jgi:hypothetical protein
MFADNPAIVAFDGQTTLMIAIVVSPNRLPPESASQRNGPASAARINGDVTLADLVAKTE